MSKTHKIFTVITIIGLMAFGFFGRVPGVHAATGTNFDSVVIIAMENQNYADVMGTGTGSSNAPFIGTILNSGHSATYPNYHSYGNGPGLPSISGCSAACYVAFMSGSTQGVSDGYCCITHPTLTDELQSSGLTWQAYCESGCGRGPDHFPFYDASGVLLPNTFASSSVSTANFISAANSVTPPNFLWFTPTDSHNMHDNSIQTGDSFLQGFLVGTGTVAAPAPGSLLASNLFQPGHRTLLMLWWDEYDPSPQLFYSPTLFSSSTIDNGDSYMEYSWLHLIEKNWGLATLTANDAAAVIPTVFSSGPQPLSSSFTVSTNPTRNISVTFTATTLGGTAPYTVSWKFGDGSTGTGSVTSHTYTTAQTFIVNETATDSSSPTQTAKSSQSVTVLATLPLVTSFIVSPSNPVVNMTVTFSGTTTGGTAPYTTSWNFGDGSTGTGTTATHVFTKAQSFTVTATSKDSSTPQQIAVSTQTVTVSSTLTGNFGTCTSLPQGWSCGNTNGLTGSSSNIVNGVFESRESNPGVGNDNSYYYSTTQKGTFPWSPCQAPATGALPTGLTSVSTTFTPITITPLGSYRYHIYVALYYWLPNGPVRAGGSNYQCLDTQVRVENIGGAFTPVGSTSTYNPGDSFGWDQITIGSVTTGGTYTLTANVQRQCQQDEAAWGISTTTPCQLAGIEIGTEGFQFQELDVNWYTVTLNTTNSPPNPTASINFTPSTPVVGQSVSFTGSAAGGTVPYTSYAWTFGDGGTGSSPTVTHQYSTTGSFTATLTVTDFAAQTGSASKIVVVSPSTAPDFTVNSNPASLSVQAGSSATSQIQLASLNGFSGTILLTATTSPGLNFSLSQTSLTLSSGSSQTFILTIGVLPTTTAGTYSVTLNTAGGSQQHSIMLTVTVTYNTPPSIQVPGPKSTVTGSPIQFVINATDPDQGETITLSATGLPPGATFDPATGAFSWTPLASQAGTYNVTFTATDNGNPPKSQSSSVIMTVQGTTPPPPSTQNQGNCPLCEITRVAKTNSWLLITSILAGFALTLTVVYLRARGRLQEHRSLKRLTRYS